MDNFQAGLRELWTGQYVQTYTSQAIQWGAEEVGTNPSTAYNIGEVGNGVIGFAGTLGAELFNDAGQGSWAINGLRSLFTAEATTENDGFNVLFGQRRIGPNFSTKAGVPVYLAGRPISGVASDLRAGILTPDQLPINAFQNEAGELISINNRTLAALSQAGLRPTIVNLTTPTKAELLRLMEEPIIDSPIPGPRIPVTPNQSDLNVMWVVETPS